MAYCPNCGSIVKDEEKFCISCGKELPKDIGERIEQKASFNKWWFLPLGAFLLFTLLFVGIYFHSSYERDQAIEAYEEGVALAIDGNFKQAKQSFEQAIEKRENLKAAIHNAQFMDVALNIQEELNSAEKLMNEKAYQQGLALTKQAEERLKNYNGTVVDSLLSQIMSLARTIRTEELKYQLEQKPSIQDLKILLWQAQTIQTEEASALTSDIRNRIIDYTYSTANEFLKLKQYSDAITLIEDGLRYAPNSEKLKSLKTTIEKEKVAFETEQQQRIQQAMDAAEKEYEFNKNNAVEIVSIEAKQDEYGDLVVSGVIKSVATVPIYSISVEYNLLNDNEEVVSSNVVFTYPDTLYPNEEGKFEFNHYDIDQELKANIVTVKWFLDTP